MSVASFSFSAPASSVTVGGAAPPACSAGSTICHSFSSSGLEVALCPARRTRRAGQLQLALVRELAQQRLDTPRPADAARGSCAAPRPPCRAPAAARGGSPRSAASVRSRNSRVPVLRAARCAAPCPAPRCRPSRTRAWACAGVTLKTRSKRARSTPRSRRYRASAAERALQRARLERGQLGLARAGGAAGGRRERIEHDAAAQRAARGLVAQDEAVAVQRADRLVEHELRQRGLARRDGGALRYRDAGRDVGGGEVQVQRRPVLERLRPASSVHARIEPLRRRVDRLRQHPVAARDGFEIGCRRG